MDNIQGIKSYKEIPVASMIDPETGIETPGEMPSFNSRVAPTAKEMAAGKAEENFLLGHMPNVIGIDVASLGPLRRSSDPEIWGEQTRLMGAVHSLRAEIDAFTETLKEHEIQQYRVAHKNLCDEAREAKGRIEELLQPLSDARNALQNAQREYQTQTIHLSNVRAQGPRAQDYPSDKDYQVHAAKVTESEKRLQSLVERVQEWSAEVTRLESKLRSAQGAFARADGAVKATARRIDRLTGAAPGKRSSYSGPREFGLG